MVGRILSWPSRPCLHGGHGCKTLSPFACIRLVNIHPHKNLFCTRPSALRGGCFPGGPEETSFHVMKGPLGRTWRQPLETGSWQPASRTQDLSPTRNGFACNLSELVANFSLIRASRKVYLWSTPSFMPWKDLTHGSYKRIHVHCFKPLSLWPINKKKIKVDIYSTKEEFPLDVAIISSVFWKRESESVCWPENKWAEVTETCG